MANPSFPSAEPQRVEGLDGLGQFPGSCWETWPALRIYWDIMDLYGIYMGLYHDLS